MAYVMYSLWVAVTFCAILFGLIAVVTILLIPSLGFLWVPAVSYYLFRGLLRAAYEPVELKKRPLWKENADGTAWAYSLVIFLLFMGVIASWVICGVTAPFLAFLATGVLGGLIAFVWIFAFVVAMISNVETMLGLTGEWSRKWIGTPAGVTWHTTWPVTHALLVTLKDGVVFIANLPVLFFTGLKIE